MIRLMGVVASLESSQLRIAPGAETTCTVRIRNTGTIVDRMSVAVVGEPGRWSMVEPATIPLFPGQEGSVRILFRIARGPNPRAGSHVFGVHVRSEQDPGASTVEEGRIAVEPFVDIGATIVPQTSRASKSARHEVEIENRGNVPAEIDVDAADPDRLLGFDVAPARLVVGPGAREAVRVAVEVRDTFFTGQPQTRPFAVDVRSAGVTAQSLRASFLQRPVLPGWLVPVAGALGALVVAVVVLPRLMGGNPAPSDLISGSSDGPSPVLSAAPSDGGGASASVPVVASPSAAPSVSLPPPPPSASALVSPGPFELTLGVEGETALDGLVKLRCPDDDQQCRAQARSAAELLIGRLLGPYDGKGVLSTRGEISPQTMTLPVALDRNVPFTWSAEGNQTGESARIIFDLAPLAATNTSFAYGVVDSANGTRRFVVPDQTARILFETLYEPTTTAMPTVPPDRTPPPWQDIFVPPDLVFIKP
jgi:hypothetical protein